MRRLHGLLALLVASAAAWTVASTAEAAGGIDTTYQQMVQTVIDAQRESLVRLRNEGAISDEVRRRVEHELDLEESRLEI